MKYLLIRLIHSFVFLALTFHISDARIKGSQKNIRAQAANAIHLDINHMNGVFNNDGTFYYDRFRGDWGLEWPKGSGLSPIFAAGVWIGAKFPDGSIRVAATQHGATEFQPGEIEAPFEAASPDDNKYRWYQLNDTGNDDRANWPVDQGALLNNQGQPLELDDLTLFSVWNDLTEHDEFGSQQMSIEVRQTAFAYDRRSTIGDIQFIKWQFINKSGMDWDSTYFAVWADPDLGGAGDDLNGCDTLLNLGFCYNADNLDQNYGEAPPATGFVLMQGPIVDDPDSTVYLPDGTVLSGKRMLKMSGFVSYMGDDSPQGNPHNSTEVWNFIRSYWLDGEKMTDPDGNPVSYNIPGDPETGEGWLDKNEADRRFLVITGPVHMPKWDDINNNGQPDFGEPGVQEMVVAAICAQGGNNLNSVSRLKERVYDCQILYDNNFRFSEPPRRPSINVSELPNEIILS